MSVVSNDLLLEIFFRLPDLGSTIQRSVVCKRWFSLISEPQFIFNFAQRHRGRRSPRLLYKFLIDSPGLSEIFERFSELSFEKPKNIGGMPAPETCPDILPWPSGEISTSFEDLLVVRRSPVVYDYCIYSPLTRQFVVLPPAPTNPHDAKCALVLQCPCNIKSQSGCNICPMIRFRLLLVWTMLVFNPPYHRPRSMVSMYCSETGQWKSTDISIPGHNFGWVLVQGEAVVSNGVAYWSLSYDNVHINKIIAFDPFKGIDHPQLWRIINMPIGFGGGWRAQAQYVRLGLVQGRLRMSQLSRVRDSSFALKVWELIYNTEDDDASTSWLLVHDLKYRWRRQGASYL